MTEENADPAGSPLLDVVQRCIDAFEDGGPAAVERELEKAPLLAAAARERIEALIATGMLEAPQATEIELPRRLGPFTLTAKLGGGGMGVVYRAVQDGLGREVAVKLVRPENLHFDGARARFQREVEAVARLAHPGIVQIHTVGETGGLPYFAMELVAGASLSQLAAHLARFNPSRLRGSDLLAAAAEIAGTSESADTDESTALRRLDWSDACTIVVRRVALALAHAHEKGVLHRDVKPSNVMLSPNGRVSLLDFGLAAASGATAITRSGSQLGSLAYMSPEQLDGRLPVDERSDVYSLGVTYYELLTLAPPYRSENTAAVIRDILRGDPQPPSRRNAAVGHDAETVCLHAMARDPTRRYATALVFAQDLANVLERRPLAAKRPGPLVIATSFAARNKAATAAITFAVLAFLVAPGLLAWNERRARLRVDAAWTAEKRARELAEADFARTREVMALIQRRVGDPRVRDNPEFDPLVRGVLSDVLPVFRQFLSDHAGDARLRGELAEAACRTAEIERELGNLDAAAAAVDEARVLAEREFADRAGDPLARKRLAIALDVACNVREARGEHEAAILDATRLLEITNHLIRDLPGRTELLLLRANGANSRGAVHAQRGEHTAAIRDMELAAEIFSQVAAAEPGSILARDGLASTHNNLGYVKSDANALDEAIESYQAAIDEYSALAKDQPAVIDYEYSITLAESGIAHALQLRGNRVDAVTRLEFAISRLEPLTERHPNRRDWRLRVASDHTTLCAWLLDAKQPSEALAMGIKAASILTALTLESPATPNYFGSLALAEMNTGAAHLALRALPAHRDALKRALPAIERAVELEPGELRWLDTRIDVTLRLGLAEIANQDVAVGAALAERVRDLAVADGFWLRKSAGMLANCAKLTKRDKSLAADDRDRRVHEYKERAIQRLRQAVEHGFADRNDLSKTEDMRILDTDPRFQELLNALPPLSEVNDGR